jgi:integrase
MKPEEIASLNIDAALKEAGWLVQDAYAVNLAAGQGIAVREFPLRTGYGFADYLLYANGQGEPLPPGQFSDRFDRLVRAAGVPRINFHGLRHTHATLALRAGVHPKVVSERLGHSTISITLDTYSHAIPAMQEEAAEKVAALVFRG